MNTILDLPTTLLAIGTLFGGAVVGLLYVVGLIGGKREKNIRTAEEANEYVIKSLQEKIIILEEKTADQQRVIEQHTKEIEFLKGQNKTLEELVVKALSEYFSNNPEIAKKLKKDYK